LIPPAYTRNNASHPATIQSVMTTVHPR
jgi:hypothetical protein